METAVNRKLYEGMFLIDTAQAADWDGTKEAIEGVLNRGNAEIVEIKKWDDRRLAYEVEGKGRGTYILCYFNADCEKISEIERGAQLSEKIMRVLVLSTERMTADDIARDTPTMKAEKDAAAAEEARIARIAEAEAKAKEASEAAVAAAAEGSESGVESSSGEEAGEGEATGEVAATDEVAVAEAAGDGEVKAEEAVAVVGDSEVAEAADAGAAVDAVDAGDVESAEKVESVDAVEGVDGGEASAEGESAETKEQDVQ